MDKKLEAEKRRISFPWVFLGAIIISGILLTFVFGLLSWNRPSQNHSGIINPMVTIIYLPTAPTTINTPKPAAILPPDILDPPSGDIISNSYVKIHGTEGAGLRLRIEPGLDSEPLYLGLEDEIFKIEEGPVEEDGYMWWYLVAPFDSDRNGWGVSNFLQPVQELD